MGIKLIRPISFKNVPTCSDWLFTSGYSPPRGPAKRQKTLVSGQEFISVTSTTFIALAIFERTECLKYPSLFFLWINSETFNKGTLSGVAPVTFLRS